MKKLLVVLLSLGLIAAFGMTASAASVNFSGSYYVVGVYDNNQQLANTDRTFSRAFYYQRIRIQPVFQIAEGLSFTTRFDAMEKQWGQTDWRGGVDDKDSSRRQQQSFGNPKIQESFEWERGYMTFMSKIGQFDIGYQSSGKWGTDFGDDEQSRPRIKLTSKIGNFVIIAITEKLFDDDTTGQAGYAGKVDADNNKYMLAGIYNFKGGNAGLLYVYNNSASNRPAANFKTKAHTLAPYVKATFGPVYLESEVIYTFGKAREFDTGAGPDVDLESLGAYIKARMNIGPAYFGGSILYSSGDDGSDPTKSKTGPASQDLDVGLILGNDALQTWEASNGNGGANGFAFDSGKQNVVMYSVFGGFNPTPKLAIQALLAYAQRDKVTAVGVNANDSKKMGTEFDITASYKLYDNLTYMVGAGYLWAGDAFKGSGAGSNANSVGNDYLLLNRISLSF